MPTREIKTTLTLDGEQQFTNALKAAERNLRVMGTSLKAAGTEFERTGDKQEYLTTKSKTLRDEIEQQEKIIEALGERIKFSADNYGEADKRTDEYRIKLNHATASLNRMRKQLEETDREAEELGRDSARVGRQISDGIDDAAQGATRSLGEMAEAMKQDFDSIMTSTGISAGLDIAGAAIGAVKSLDDFAEETREGRIQHASLEQAASEADVDFEKVKTLLIEVTGLTGEASSSVAGLSELLSAGFDESELVDAVENISGALILFPEKFSFDGLASGLNETIKTGAAAGEFGELLVQLGVDTEEFNEAMGNSETQAGRMQIALAYLTGSGLEETKQKYDENNAAMKRAAEASARLEYEITQFGGTVDKVLAPVKETAAEALEGLTNYLTGGYKALADAHGMTEEALREETSKKTASNHSGKDGWFHFDEMGEAVGNIFDGGEDGFINRLFGDPRGKGKKAGKDAAEGTQEGLEEAGGEVESTGETLGSNIGTAIGNGIGGTSSYVIGQFKDMADAAIYQMDRINQYKVQPQIAPMPGKGAQGGAGLGMVQVAVNLDGREMGRGLAPYVDEFQGMTVERVNG